MREIKYRAWLKPFVNYKGITVQGEMYKVHSIHFGTKRVIITSKGYGNVSVEFDRIILEEFTGLPDINGKEIYEGDIVTSWLYPFTYKDPFVTEKNYVGVVAWSEMNLAFYLEMFPISKRVRGSACGGLLASYEAKKLEVIGNIHDNPELLEAPHDNA